jgi:RNA polymerase sigma-70 factor (sigma-E family)
MTATPAPSSGQDSFTAFVAARSQALCRTAYVLTGNRHDAEDLVQTALYKAAKQWRRIDHAPEPYVRRILYNESVSRWRRRRARPDELSTATVPEPRATSTGDIDTRLTLEVALARLTPKQRTILVLRYYEDLSESQTAVVLGIRLGTVKSQTRHALLRIRELSPDLADLVDPDPDTVATR